MFRALLR